MKFSFVYEKEKFVADDTVVIGDLKVTRETERIGGAEISLLSFENLGERDTGRLSRICDLDDVFCFEEDVFHPACRLPETFLRVWNMAGSTCSDEDFFPSARPLFHGKSLDYGAPRGRSSEETAPFFDLNRGEEGVILAIGWSGQWFCSFERGRKDVRVRAGIPDLSFYLRPGEKIRTASVLVLPYSAGQDAAHNALRAVMRARMPAALRGRQLPLSFFAWGGATTEHMLKEISFVRENKLPYEALWIDAGWYGTSKLSCDNAFEGDWNMHTGDWRVNPLHHPDGLKEVAAAAKEAGLEVILWMEPERVVTGTPHFAAHPEMYLRTRWAVNENMLNLGRKDAEDYFVDTVSRFVEELGISCLRQDFNMDPLPLWRENDEEGRQGLTQIKHIAGLYSAWDRLLEKYPNLYIDNCASGGRRIDIETLRRSVPLWRSDSNCVFDVPPETMQNHNEGLSWWVPCAGLSAGRKRDGIARVRSAHAAALVSEYYCEEESFPRGEEAEEIRGQLEEYLRVRPLISTDYYPVFGFGRDNLCWAGWQYHDPERDEGFLAAFRRSECLCDRAVVSLRAVDPAAEYEVTEEGKGAKVCSGKALSKGMRLTIGEKGGSLLLRYKRAR